ncbi:MAG TPA: SDR family NAD(P)-dependent oxidoreductase [Bacteroidales bacterium]|nr:SDR family NAD(P)-dependent oxidoreductase [Bacteroidales bacterium]
MHKKDIFYNKRIWITGASSGIGEALVYELSERGAHLIISSNDIPGLERVKNACLAKSPDIRSVPFDLADTSAINSLVEKQLQDTGGIDFLFNIGGISQRARIEDTPLWLDRKIFEINYFGTIALTKAILPYMIQQKSGHIAATSSISGRFGFPLRSAYSASKQALHGFFETLYLENKENNIRTSVIIPGRVRTNISIHALDGEGREHGKMDSGQADGITPQKAVKQILKGIALNRREILVGGSELTMLYIRRIWPWLFFRIGDKIKST